jgi:hypothetical protein
MNVTLSWRGATLALLLTGLMFVSVWLSARQDVEAEAYPPLTSYSAAPDGARALALWLAELGYAVRRAEGARLNVNREDRVLLVLEPQQSFSTGEIKVVDSWVQEGGTLIVATSRAFADPLLAHFGLDVEPLGDVVETAVPVQPVLLDPLWAYAQARAEHYLVTQRDDIVAHMLARGRPVLLSFAYGRGRVWVTTVVLPFSNAGLRHPDNARLVYNLVALAGEGGRVVFDEFHHGYRQPRTLTTWLKTTAQGRSLIYVGGVVFLFLLVGGRRFGRPLTWSRATSRRAPAEYVQAMANLFRRGGKDVAVLRHYHSALKRGLAQSHRLDPTLDDETFVAQLALAQPDVDCEALLKLLQKTGKNKTNAGELLALAQEVDDWTRKTG